MAPPRELDLSDEVEGEQDGTTDFVFRLAGDPIPLLPTASNPLPIFDLQSPPARPLAVSDRHAAVFLAHPTGFMAVRTKTLIEASKEAREKGKASTRCVEDCCATDVPLPGVSLLELSRDDSVLAACTGSEIHFFSSASLLTDKDVEPSSSCRLGEPGTVKDFKWLNQASTSYVVLSSGGLLSQGSLGEGLKDAMENVDAVDCCKDGNHIVIARNKKLSILSADFKETCCMSLLFQLWSDERDSEDTVIKVDSIGWVRDDSIVVGCVQLNEEGNEEGYLVQIIISGGNSFFESSSKAAVFTYMDFFRGIMDDVLPYGVGPNLLLGYLHRWGLMLALNKKCIDEHISLLKWLSTTGGKNTVIYLEMLEDKYGPRIDLQENGDDNVILGFGVENVSLFQKITVVVGPEQKEVAPQHVLLCLTGEGKLIIYYLARISDPSDLPQTNMPTTEYTNEKKQISSAIVSGKELSPGVTSSMAKSSPAEHEAEPSSDQAGRVIHGSLDAKSSPSVSQNKETSGNIEAFPSSHGSPLPQQAISKSHNRTHTSADYSGNFKLGTKFDTEQDLSKKFYSINSMTKELDTLLAHIEKDGGFRDACITFQQRPLSMIEADLLNFSELLQVFKIKCQEQCSKIEDLRNIMFQVSARQVYMKGILSQSLDTEYWNIWNRQKLSPEFEVKRQNILKANQNLTNQLVELERHFNNLEMNKFGEQGRTAPSRRAIYANKSRSSQTQLSSVYNALNSQLAAAEQLSECLSKQISTLNISSPSMKRGAVTKELFESIGLTHTTDTANFSGGTPSKSIKRFPSVKENTKCLVGPSKSSEPETARRRRESLDRNLASLEPQKTTVKRIAQQQRLKISSDLPFRSNKKIFDSQMAAIYQENSSDSPTSSIVESYASRLHSPTEALHEKTKPSGPQHTLFKWAKESAGPSQGLEQKHLELPGRMKNVDQPSKLAPSSPLSFSYTKDVPDSVSSSNVVSSRTTHIVPKSNTLTFKTTVAPKSNANTQSGMSSAKSPLPVKTLSGESEGGSTLTTKNRPDVQAISSSGTIKGFSVSPQNTGSIFGDLNKPSLSSEPSKSAVSHGKTSQLSGISETVENPTKATPEAATQPLAFTLTPVAQSSSDSIKLGVSSSATSHSSTIQTSATKISDVLSPTDPSILPSQKAMLKISSSVSEDTVSTALPSTPTPVKEMSSGLNQNVSKPGVFTSEVTGTTVSASIASSLSITESKASLHSAASVSLPSASGPVSVPKIVPTAAQSAVLTSTGKDVGPSDLSLDEDDMEEESPSVSVDLNLGALGGFGLGSAPTVSAQKSSPFGSSFSTSGNESSGSAFTLTNSPGQLFRPASLSIPSAQPAQPPQSTNSNTFSSTFSSGLSGFGQPAQIGGGQPSGFAQPAQSGAGQQAGFGQPAQIQSAFGKPAQVGITQQSGFGQPAEIRGGQQSGFGGPAQFGAQQALGSVLGSFGQSRQLGSFAAGGFGGFANPSTSGGFSSPSSSNTGFAGAASGGGFSAAATTTGGGFAALASKGGGFAAAASSGGGFGGANQGGGFGGGGFGAFGINQGSGFSAFGAGGSAGPGRPPADFLTQMRK